MFFQRAAAATLAVLGMELMLVRLCSGWLIPRWWSSCYVNPPIGCFPVTYPHNNTGGLAPQDPDSLNVEFLLYHAGAPRREFNIHNAEQVLGHSYNSSAKTVVIIHGYLENAYSNWIRRLSSELLQEDPTTNVVVVSWSSTALIYYQSVADARVVGAIVALFLEKLTRMGADRSDFHVIGFSLGAHVAGHVGSRLPGIGRITGLDPARPGFEEAAPEARLDPSDAVLVDVIHTDGAPAVGVGTLMPMGTVDFYPNSGVSQPGCPVSVIDKVSAVIFSFDFTSLKSAVGCSHLRVTSLFTASISSNCSYTTQHCHTLSDLSQNRCDLCEPGRCPVMGYNIDKTNITHLAGLYMAVTTDRSPYC